MKLLFTEDSTIFKDDYLDYVRKYFREIYEVSYGQKILELYKRISPNLLILNANSDKYDVVGIVKEIRESDNNTNIIIINDKLTQEELLELVELNITKFLVKPLNLNDFKEAIKKSIILSSKIEYVELANNYYWYPSNKELFKDSQKIKLTKSEILLFEEFCKDGRDFFTLEDIFTLLYGEKEKFNPNKTQMILKRLRKKTYTDIILNTYALGYKFNIITK